ncbi:MAG: hypothetical protein HQK54_04885 [Oligoflexales bacterium]|nr:hypothetical protein [Oligoflexales bacterium]
MIESKSSLGSRFFLEISHPSHDYLELYVISSDGKMRIMKGGDQYPYNIRPIDHQNFVFPLQIQKGESLMMLLRSEGIDAMIFPMTLWEPDHFYSVKSQELILFGLYYGMIFVMLLYNFFLFASIRNPSYLFYSIYVTSYMIYQASINGLSFRYLWPESR